LLHEIENSIDRIDTATGRLDDLHQRLFGATSEPDRDRASRGGEPATLAGGTVQKLQFLTRRLDGAVDRLGERVNSFGDLA
jgi:hypothetical protein